MIITVPPANQNANSSQPCHQHLSLPLFALIDSGAEGNFLDEGLALQSSILLEYQESPHTASVLNGKLLVLVTHFTVPVTAVLSGNYGESIEFKTISSPRAPLVLGHLKATQS